MSVGHVPGKVVRFKVLSSTNRTVTIEPREAEDVNYFEPNVNFVGDIRIDSGQPPVGSNGEKPSGS